MSALARLWLCALAVAGLGAWMLFDAEPGLGWALWTLAVAAASEVARRTGPRERAPLDAVRALALSACALAAGGAVTADAALHVAIALAVSLLIAAAVAIADDPRPDRLTPALLARAPLGGPARAVAEAGRRVAELVDHLGAERWRPAMRGSLLAVLVVGVFGSLLATADPILAAIRDGLAEALEELDFLPRLLFFGALLTGALGAGGRALRGAPAPAQAAREPAARWTDVERLIALGAAAGLFAVFLALQVAYLFGNPAAVAGSGVTFAEYARRGFAELTVVATLATLLVLALERGRRTGTREGLVRALELVLLVEVELLLVSAFRRVWLYEDAYGFTTARLHAQAYMIAMAVALALFARELVRGLDAGRLLRRAGGIAVAAVVALSVWNHEASIVRWNLERHARTGRLDAQYLVWQLSPSAVPAIVRAAPGAPPALGEALRERYGAQARVAACRWFEWNLGHRRAVDALAAAGQSIGNTAPGRVPRGCVRLDARR
jgi:hypothetical protein